ncbi:hypothetical protein LCGC14_1527450 [marine sediment metagenome]|uniref:Uncharacterized protein n=1 Tax=marine sediment metagenome TaxID=412755 RepID=A0A0F9JHS2_9ZZZZ
MNKNTKPYDCINCDGDWDDDRCMSGCKLLEVDE